MKKLLGLLLCFMFSFSVYAQNQPKFIFLPNVITKYLESIDTVQVLEMKNKIINLVQKTLNINESSPYRTVRIRVVYNKTNHKVKYLVVYLLSSINKTLDLVRINLLPDLTVVSVENNYELQMEDLAQSPIYAHPLVGRCPSNNVQFVIGNNFEGDDSVEKEVQKTYALAKSKGYNPVLLDINDSKGPQPTVQAYLNWMSCPQLKGFYNESHGWSKGIVLSDDDFTYSILQKKLVNKWQKTVVLFDSCQTFHNPLLDSATNKKYANGKQYIAGFISLPFGASERTATCFWNDAFNSADLHQKMIEVCADKNGLQTDGYKIAGNGDNHLERAS